MKTKRHLEPVTIRTFDESDRSFKVCYDINRSAFFAKKKISNILQFIRTKVNFKNGNNIQRHSIAYFDYQKQEGSYIKSNPRKEYGYNCG